MSCVNPPLSKKPPKGFAWQCAFCSRKEFQDIDTIKSQQQQSSNKPAPRTTNATMTKPVAKRQTRTSARIQSQQSMPTATDKNTMDTNNPSQQPPSQQPLSDIKLNASNEKGTTTHVPS